jgi:hypothetical protein
MITIGTSGPEIWKALAKVEMREEDYYGICTVRITVEKPGI